MKRVTLMIAMLLLIIQLSACSFSVDFSGCSGIFNKDDQSQPEIDIPIPDTSDVKINFELIERNNLYYPTLTGKIKFDFYPEKITLFCCNQEKELMPTNVEYVPSYINGIESYNYKFSFDQEILFDSLTKGENAVVIYGYDNENKYANPEQIKLICPSDMELSYHYDCETGKSQDGMDREDLWTDFY